ncbi:WWE protein-protein interaction domain protein family [Striga asiatica]|uniref:WWE protein-protein interaction domain protein family n=1 Tax=Striga asiatica TaxID=4170 RepID=A0A5A7QV67_STRAF|nr:WWE protein-protein interaction domain protein family [Striga asiatica]
MRESFPRIPSEEVNEKRMVFSSAPKSAMEERKGPSKRDKEMLALFLPKLPQRRALYGIMALATSPTFGNYYKYVKESRAGGNPGGLLCLVSGPDVGSLIKYLYHYSTPVFLHGLNMKEVCERSDSRIRLEIPLEIFSEKEFQKEQTKRYPARSLATIKIEETKALTRKGKLFIGRIPLNRSRISYAY